MDPATFSFSDDELSTALEEVDAELRRDGGPVHGREISGWMKFCARLQLEGLTWSHPLSVRVFDWFRERYGDKLKIDFDFGRTVVAIQHDLFGLRCVRVFGTVFLVCDPLLLGIELGPALGINRPSQANMLNYLVEITPTFAKSLSIQECSSILDAYVRAFLAFSRVEDAAQAVYAKEALTDLRDSGARFTLARAEYGFSRWSSLQAVEKLLKSYVRAEGTQPPRHHDLGALASLAYSLGLPQLPSSVLKSVQCTADIRYDSSSATKELALEAHLRCFVTVRRNCPLPFTSIRVGQHGAEDPLQGQWSEAASARAGGQQD